MSTLTDSSLKSWDDLRQRGKLFIPLLGKHIKLHGLAWLLVIALYCQINANYRLAINTTPSLPYTLYLIKLDARIVSGGFIAFRWHHGPPYPDGYLFVKRSLAIPGDSVSRKGRDFEAGNRVMVGKAIGLTKRALYPNDQLQEGSNIISPGKYFVGGDHEYSLDSRYSLLGLVDEKDVVGRAYPLF